MDVHVIRVLDRHRLGFPLSHHGPLVVRQRHGVQGVPMGLPQQSNEFVLPRLGDLVHRMDSGPPQVVPRRRPHPRQGPHRHGPEQRPLGPRFDQYQPIRLGLLRGDLRQHLGRRQPHRPRESGDRAYVGPQFHPHQARRLLVPGRSSGFQIHEGFVQTQGLHQRRQLPQQLHHLLADLAVDPEAWHEVCRVGRQPTRLSHGHRRVNPENTGLIGRGGDDSPRPQPAHDHGLPAQARLGCLLHRGVEGIHVEMQDRGRVSHISDAASRH